MTAQATDLKHGDKVKCLAGDIDRNRGAGAAGEVAGFARFSSYHPREVYVSTEEGGGWFWERDVVKDDEALEGPLSDLSATEGSLS